jgi:hypothetical protein
VEEQGDKLNIRHNARMVTDTSPAFVTVPSYAYPADHPDFDVAKTPPPIDFAIVQVTPEYLENGTYGGWGENRLGPDGKYYFSIGNHRDYGGADAFLIAYDPATKTHETVLSSMQVCGWGPQDFGDAKLHGEPDIAPNGDMWLLTFYGPYPKLADWGKNYHGGHLIRFNIFTRKAEYLGHPVADDSWPIHVWDWKRNLLLAVGEWGLHHDQDKQQGVRDQRFDYGKILVYDTKARRLVYAGVPEAKGTKPPERIRWWRRGLLLDRETGMLYGAESVAPYRMARYDPRKNEFRWTKTQLKERLLSWPTTKSPDGAFWLFDYAGNMYKFFPKQDRVEEYGKNWLNGAYIQNMRLSPGGRYLYYISESSQEGSRYGLPLVQYDTLKNRKKVIAFLEDFYVDKYGYAASNTYGVSLSADGSSVFTHMNGRFAASREQAAYGRPAIYHIHIPASERADDRAPGRR